MSELKPCPFCGGNGKIIKLNHKGANGEYKVFVKCERCDCRTYTEYPLPHDSYLTRLERVVSLWNTRTDPKEDRLQQENEQLREQLNKFEDLQTPKEANEHDCCPRCSTYLKDDNGVEGDYCPNCGQRIKWLKELGVEVRSGY